MKKLKHRYQRWKAWCKLNNFSKLKQILIFLHVIHNGWFENFVDWSNLNAK